MRCDKCGKTQWAHYMKGSRNGWLFCDESYADRPSFTLDEIAETYRVAGRPVPRKLRDKISVMS